MLSVMLEQLRLQTRFEVYCLGLTTNENETTLMLGNRCGVVVSLRASKRKVWASKFYEITISNRKKGHLEFKVQRCSSTKSFSKAGA